MSYEQVSEIDDILNKKSKWNQIGTIIQNWCNYNEKYKRDTDEDVYVVENANNLKLTVELRFEVCVTLMSDKKDKVNGETLYKKMKWINTMVNSLIQLILVI